MTAPNAREVAAWNKLVRMARDAKVRADREGSEMGTFTMGILAAEGELQHLRLEHALAHPKYVPARETSPHDVEDEE